MSTKESDVIPTIGEPPKNGVAYKKENRTHYRIARPSSLWTKEPTPQSPGLFMTNKTEDQYVKETGLVLGDNPKRGPAVDWK